MSIMVSGRMKNEKEVLPFLAAPRPIDDLLPVHEEHTAILAGWVLTPDFGRYARRLQYSRQAAPGYKVLLWKIDLRLFRICWLLFVTSTMW